VREFFFPRLLIICSLFVDSIIVFVSYSNILLGREGEGTSSYLTPISYWQDVVRESLRISLDYRIGER